MFRSLAQLLLLSHICLCRDDGTIEESIRTKRVISYLDPESGERDFSRYERKKVVETFHHIVKKILPPYPSESFNETDFKSLDTKVSQDLTSLSLNSKKSTDFVGNNVRKRRGIEIPNSFDFVIENKGKDGNVLSEVRRYSIKMVNKEEDHQETTTTTTTTIAPKPISSEHHKGNDNNIWISLRAKVDDSNQSQTEVSNDSSSSTSSPTTEKDQPITKNYSLAELKSVKQYLLGLKKEKEAKKMTTLPPETSTSVSNTSTNTKPPKKSKQHSKSSNKIPKKFVIHIQSKPTENDVKIDMDMLVSLLFPKGPRAASSRLIQSQQTQNSNNNTSATDGNSKVLFMWVLGVLSLLGFVLLAMTVYLSSMRCLYRKGNRSEVSKEKLPPSVYQEVSGPPGGSLSKSEIARRWTTPDLACTPPKNLKNLLGKFCEVLGKCEDLSSEMMSQMYSSAKHCDEVKQRVVIKGSSVF